jgi:beta-glucanase (GH16 family)
MIAGVLLAAHVACASPFIDGFDSGIDPARWRLARTQWENDDDNGGVVPENVSVRDGLVLLEGHGDLYTGPVHGIRETHGKLEDLPDGHRVGAAIVTTERYASGRYEIRIRIPRRLGACSAIWTYHEEETADDHTVQHEIDVEVPGRPADPHRSMSYEWALLNTWIGEKDNEHTVGYTRLPKAVNDGRFHDWRFDWHTGGNGQPPRVDWYLDGRFVRRNTTHVPSIAGRLWIGIWFPDDWAGQPDFDREVTAVDRVAITPFHEPGDRDPAGDDGADRLVAPR